jgi:hypothetical protein
MMEGVLTSETSVSFNMTTRRYIPEDSKLCDYEASRAGRNITINRQDIHSAGK